MIGIILVQGLTELNMTELYCLQTFEIVIVFHSICRLREYLSLSVGKLIREITFAKCLKCKNQYILTYRQCTKVMGTFSTPSHLCQLKLLKAFCLDSILQLNLAVYFECLLCARLYSKTDAFP